jgi:hypothetical protein
MIDRQKPMRIGYFDEAPNHKSSARLMAFLSFLAAVGFGAWSLAKVDARDAGFNLAGAFLAASVTGKSLGKFAEVQKQTEN